MREDPGGLEQRERQDRDHHPRHIADQLAVHARNPEKRGKGGHRGQYPEGGREEHPPGAANRRFLPALPTVVHPSLDVLAHHDRVVHHDAEGHDEREHAEQVDGDPEPRHQQEGAEERERQSGRRPDGKAGREREEEDQEDESETGQPVPDHEIQTALEILGCEVPRRDPDPVGEFHRPDDLPRAPGGVRQPATVLQQNAQEHRRLAVHRGFAIRRREAVGHRGDVREPHHAAAGRRDDRNSPEVRGGRRRALGTQAEFMGAAPCGARGDFRGAQPDGVRDPVEGQSEPRQVLLRDLDGQFLIPARQPLHGGHPGHRHHRVVDAPGRLVEISLAHRPVHGDPEDLPVPGDFGNHGILRLGRKRGEGSHPFAHRVPDPANVRPGLEYQREPSGVVRREPAHLPHALDAPERFLE